MASIEDELTGRNAVDDIGHADRGRAHWRQQLSMPRRAFAVEDPWLGGVCGG
jgi:hypothetical protein